MNLARYNDDDLTSEPSLDEALADPVIRAVMLRDGISRDDVENVALAARARLLAPRGVIAAFPGRGRSAEPGRDYHGQRLRPRSRVLLVARREPARR
jgi:hypothetical protein